jgi:RNA polymerase sigma factor (TIGR02999 family)
VDRARRKSAAKRGGREVPVDIDDVVVAVPLPDDDVLALDEALTALEREEPRRAEIVKLRYFAGFSRQEIAATLGVSTRTIDREWRYIMARLHQEIRARAGDVGPRNNTE